jgi:site-specific DNA recombinase
MIAAIYARKSTEQNGVADEQKSVARQVEHARAYAERKGWTVSDDHVYIDDGISGAEFANRPGFLRLMSALKPRPPFQVLVMSEESRLGREAIETAYALKQIVTAGVRVFFYLEDRERTLDSPTDKIMLSLTAFADELEREKARQRTYDAMQRKARAGHVTGSACFGYRNIRTAAGHVERQIDNAEAEVIRRIFRLAAEGFGQKAIAKMLNAAGALSPQAQQGRSRTWAPTSVREVLFRPAYRGEIVWNQTRKRDTWGRKHQTGRPEADWVRQAAPALRIVTDAEWKAAHARLDAARAVYLRGTNGRPFGRPALGSPSKYLLTGLARCGECGNGLIVKSRSHGQLRAYFYACGGYHNRGTAVCTNYTEIPMDDGNGVVLEALLDDVLDESILTDAVNEALHILQGDGRDAAERQGWLDAELRKVGRERDRLIAAIATGGRLDGLLLALQARETRWKELHAERDGWRAQRPLRDTARMRDDLLTLAGAWRTVLADDPSHARPIVSELLKGRVTFTPTAKISWWELRGQSSIDGLFTRVFASGLASPTGSDGEWKRLDGWLAA